MRKSLAGLTFCACVSFASAESFEGPSKPIFEKGLAAYDAGHFEEAYKIFSSIEDEDVAAMRNVAFMRRHGQGTKLDPKGAEVMYERAARAGLPTAQADLGDMLLKGEGGKADPAKAAIWLALASAAHHPIAEYELAQLFESGTGIQRDLGQARKLYVDAVERGVPGAKDRLAALDASHPELIPAKTPTGHP